jgi:Helix-turn-helix domain
MACSEFLRLSLTLTGARILPELRGAAGLSQAKLAERMGVDRAYVSGLEYMPLVQVTEVENRSGLLQLAPQLGNNDGCCKR